MVLDNLQQYFTCIDRCLCHLPLPLVSVIPSTKDDLDIAGLYFDPSGGFVYVISMYEVAAWSIRGAEERWWSNSQWA